MLSGHENSRQRIHHQPQLSFLICELGVRGLCRLVEEKPYNCIGRVPFYIVVGLITAMAGSPEKD